MLIIYLPIILSIHYFTVIFNFFFFLSLLLVLLLLLLLIMMVKRDSILVMNYKVTGEFITYKEFGLLISESLEWSLYIFLYPTSSPSASFFIYFILHILFISLILFSRFIPSAFISYHPHSCPVLNYCFLPLATYQWLPTYLSPIVTFAYSQFLPWREIRIILSK